MIQITQMEADYLIKNVSTRQLTKSSARKRHGGKTYYIRGDDVDSLKALAMLRGYLPIRKRYIDRDEKVKYRVTSPVQQLCADY